MWRGGCRSNIAVAASFVWRCLSGSTMTPFPHPAHRSGQADFPHPACMGLSLSRASRHSLSSILLFDRRREHSSAPTALSIIVVRGSGQGRHIFSAAEDLSLTDGSGRHSGGWPRDDPRGACHWPRSIARTTLVFG